MGEKTGNWRWRVVSAVFFAVTAVAITLMIRGQDWSVLATTVETRQPAYFVTMAALAVLANAVAILAAMVSWQTILGSGVGGNARPDSAARQSGEVSRNDAARIYFVGQFAKYMPGKVFSFVVSIRMGKAAGISPSRMASAWLLSLVVGLLTGATVAVAAGPELLHGSQGAWVAVAALPIVAVLARPKLIGQAAALVARLRRKPPPEGEIPPRTVRKAVLTQLLSWVAGGAHLWLLTVAMGAPVARSFPLCVGVFGLATVAGMFAVFTTDGLGVREVILLSALSAVLPVPVAGVVALVSRLVVVVSELTTAAVGLAVTQMAKRQGSAKVRPTRMNPATEDR